MCGVPGIKPTYGRVPAWPPSPFGLLAHLGPMARTVTDTALLLDVLSEPDARDWSALPPLRASFLDGIDGGIGGLRVAFSPTLGHVDVDPEVAQAVAAAAGALAELGAHVEQVDPGFEDPRETYETLWYSGAAMAIGDLGDPDLELLDPGLAKVVEMARGFSAQEYVRAGSRRDALGLQMSSFLEDWDLLVTPTLPLAAFPAGRDVPEGSTDPLWPSWTPFTYPFNLTQQPAASVPCGFTADGLPIGVQIVGPRHGDALVLRAARAYEAANPQPTLAPSGDAA
jgi:aspartyl-tRNA(Asn)/glutamyl-tRNA(Gln) amidotransferase subunit A